MKIIKRLLYFSALLVLIFTISSCGKNKIVFEVEQTNIILEVGETYSFEPRLENVTNPRYAFSTSESNIVEIVSRKITGLKPGVCEITISLRDYPKVKSITLIVEVVENKE